MPLAKANHQFNLAIHLQLKVDSKKLSLYKGKVEIILVLMWGDLVRLKVQSWLHHLIHQMIINQHIYIRQSHDLSSYALQNYTCSHSSVPHNIQSYNTIVTNIKSILIWKSAVENHQWKLVCWWCKIHQRKLIRWWYRIRQQKLICWGHNIHQWNWVLRLTHEIISVHSLLLTQKSLMKTELLLT